MHDIFHLKFCACLLMLIPNKSEDLLSHYRRCRKIVNSDY